MNRILGLSVVFTILALTGCGTGVSDVSGTVTYAGKPLSFGTVIIADSEGTLRNGVLSTDGTYTIENVRSGAVKIYIQTSIPGVGGNSRGARPGREVSKPVQPPPGWVELPAKYGNPDTSGLDTTIEAGKVTHNIDLK